MSIKINYKNTSLKNHQNNIVLFTDEKFNIRSLNRTISNSEYSYINDLLKNSDLSKNLFVFELSSKKVIVLVSIKKNLKNYQIENLGAELYGRINYGKNRDYSIDADSINSKQLLISEITRFKYA